MSKVLIGFAALAAFAFSAESKSKMYKCQINGSMLYSEAPCDSANTKESERKISRPNFGKTQGVEESVRTREFEKSYYEREK